MNELHEEKKSKRKKIKFYKLLKPKFIIPIVVVIAISSLAIGIKVNYNKDGATTRLGFEDIGELATQSANCTSIRVEDKDRKLFGVSIPFTQTKYIYTYDTTVKAGIDFSKVTVKPIKANEIYIDIPEIKILSIDVDYDSFKIYHEEESIFSPISMEEHNDSMKDLEETAKKDAISNGLLDSAYDNAKNILKAFLKQTYDPQKYKFKFSEMKKDDTINKWSL